MSNHKLVDTNKVDDAFKDIRRKKTSDPVWLGKTAPVDHEIFCKLSPVDNIPPSTSTQVQHVSPPDFKSKVQDILTNDILVLSFKEQLNTMIHSDSVDLKLLQSIQSNIKQLTKCHFMNNKTMTIISLWSVQDMDDLMNHLLKIVVMSNNNTLHNETIHLNVISFSTFIESCSLINTNITNNNNNNTILDENQTLSDVGIHIDFSDLDKPLKYPSKLDKNNSKNHANRKLNIKHS